MRQEKKPTNMKGKTFVYRKGEPKYNNHHATVAHVKMHCCGLINLVINIKAYD